MTTRTSSKPVGDEELAALEAWWDCLDREHKSHVIKLIFVMHCDKLIPEEMLKELPGNDSSVLVRHALRKWMLPASA